MRQSVPFPFVIAQSVTSNLMQSTKAEYFDKDIVWEIIDRNRDSVCYRYGKRTKVQASNNKHTCVSPSLK
jgi:hypothetical protein